MFLNNGLARRVVRKQIEAVIETDPRPIVIERAEFRPDGAGGKIRLPRETLPPQWGKLVGNSPAFQLPLRATEDGRTVQVTNLLIMPYKADVKQGDVFEDLGIRYEVVYVHTPSVVKTTCEVILHA